MSRLCAQYNDACVHSARRANCKDVKTQYAHLAVRTHGTSEYNTTGVKPANNYPYHSCPWKRNNFTSVHRVNIRGACEKQTVIVRLWSVNKRATGPAANGVTRRKRVTDCRVSVAPRGGETAN
ncbi:hypothetical protein CBL_10032 [Carabus blaptoides fortunei]